MISNKIMRKLLPILVIFAMTLSLGFASEVTDTIEDFELNVDLQRLVINNAEDQGKDVSTARMLLTEFEEAVDDLKDTYAEYGEGIETQKAQNAAWGVLVKIGEEYERLEINFGDDNKNKEKEAQEQVEEAIENFDTHFEVLDTLVEVAELQGKDVSEAKAAVNSLRSRYDTMVNHYNKGEYKDAQRELFRIFLDMPDLQEKLEDLGIEGDEDNRPVKERVEETLTKFEYPIQVLDLVLDNAEAEGKNVSIARNTLDEMESTLSEIDDLYEEGEYDNAWRKVMRLFVLGVRLQNDLADLDIDLDDGRTSQEKVKEAIDGFEVHEESINFVFTQAGKKGKDIKKAKALFDEMKSLMVTIEDLYDKGKYEEAEQVLFQVYIKSPEFQEEFQKVVKSLEDTPEEMRAKLQDTLDEYEMNLPLIRQFIEFAKDQSKDTEKIEGMLDEFEDHMEDVREKFDEGDYKNANRKLQRAYLVAMQFQKEFEKLNEIDKDEIRQNIDDAKEGIAFAKDIVKELKRAGLEVEDAENLIEKIEKRMKRVEDLYQAGEYKKASKELTRAFSLGAKLQAISSELIKEYEGE
ncbi:MAG: hypothetical protein GOU98_01870 [Candidatus Altiarchaeota archaeon]|nr:hypothetical protein [Candidatus Altiarchaeota archaeon]